MLKLFAFEGAETDWVAAHTEAEARDVLKRHYGISDEDIAGSYEDISEVEPTQVKMYRDGYDYEDDEAEPSTAAETIAGKTRPFVVGSTAT